MLKKLLKLAYILLCIVLIAGLAYQYRLISRYEFQTGSGYKSIIDHFTLDITKWDKSLLDNGEQINKNDLISIASEANECAYSCINLPQYMSFINVYFINISNDLLDLSTESTNSTTQRKQLLLSDAQNNINILKNILKTVNGECNKDDFKYYKELTNINSNLNNKIRTTLFK